jgi:hypothetical protein
MNFVRFTGEWVIYFVLIVLGGGVLMALTRLILEPINSGFAEHVTEWVMPSGAAGAVIVAAWLVESKQHVVENMAPVLSMLFTPLFAVMLTVAAVTYAGFGAGRAFDRELLGVFDALLVVVLGLVLYAMSARQPAQPPGLMDRVQFVAIGAALVRCDACAHASVVCSHAGAPFGKGIHLLPRCHPRQGRGSHRHRRPRLRGGGDEKGDQHDDDADPSGQADGLM